MERSNSLSKDWSVHLSRSQNRQYYFNQKTNERIWVDPDLPYGWTHGYNAEEPNRKFYFHISDRKGSKTFDKPISGPSETKLLDETIPGYDSTTPKVIRTSTSTPSTIPPAKLTPKISGSSNGVAISSPTHERVSLERRQSKSEVPTLNPKSSSFSIDNILNEGKPVAENKSPVSLKRKEPYNNDQLKAASFYDNLKRNNRDDRGNSLVFHLRAMNNWIKSILIDTYCHKNMKVLDLACGKGGDMFKWTRQDISSYVGVDIARQSLEDAVSRMQSNRQGNNIEIRFGEADLGEINLRTDEINCWNCHDGWHNGLLLLPNEQPFGLISIQFALHYMFGSEARARHFFQAASDMLITGGYLIATTIDADAIVQKLLSHTGKYLEDGSHSPIQIQDENQRDICEITFDPSTVRRLLGYDNSQNDSLFGLRYNFVLRDSEEQGEAVDAPEYLIPSNVLSDIVKEFGLEICLRSNFCDFIHKSGRDGKYKPLLERMHVLNFQGSISDVEWEIVGLYQVLAFRKL